MSHHVELEVSKAGIHQVDVNPVIARIPSRQLGHVTIETLLQSRSCCKLLIFWSILTTLASLISLYYAIDVHNSFVEKREFREKLMSRDYLLENPADFDGPLRPR